MTDQRAEKHLGLRLDPELHKRLRIRGIEEERTAAAVVRSAIEAYLRTPLPGRPKAVASEVGAE